MNHLLQTKLKKKKFSGISNICHKIYSFCTEVVGNFVVFQVSISIFFDNSTTFM